MKRFITTISLITGIFLFSAAAQCAVVKVVLKPESEVQPSRPVAIKDIATVEGPKEAAQKAGDVTIATSPSPGQRRTIDSNYIKSRLKSASLGMGVNLVGPDTVSVVSKCSKLTSQQLTDEAINYIQSLLPQENRTYDISIQRSPRDVVVAAGENIRICPRLYSSSLHPGVNTVALDVEVDGKIAVTTSAVVQIKTTAEVLVAIGTIQTGQPLTSENTTRELRDITRINDPLIVQSNNENNEWIAGRVISAGSTIRSSDVKLTPDIRKGDNVSLVVKCGKVTLHATAEAKQDGKAGDTIRLLSAVSKEDVRARIVGPGIAEIRR